MTTPVPDITPEPVPPFEPTVAPVVTKTVKTHKIFRKDMIERAASTFWQGALGVLVLSEPTTNWHQLKQIGIAAAVAGIAAVGSLAKSQVVRYRGIMNSASSSTSV